jgi:hypothetical protein
MRGAKQTKHTYSDLLARNNSVRSSAEFETEIKSDNRDNRIRWVILKMCVRCAYRRFGIGDGRFPGTPDEPLTGRFLGS